MSEHNSRYHLYLLSDEWKQKRKEVFRLKGKICERCKNTRRLNVHHATYERLFNEELGDLFVLCGKCHEDYHKKNPLISIESTSNFILSYEKPEIKMTIRVKKDRNIRKINSGVSVQFNIMSSCRCCGDSLMKYETLIRKKNPKHPISPYYYKCNGCRKVYFPKLIPAVKRDRFLSKKAKKEHKKSKKIANQAREEREMNLRRMLVKGVITREEFDLKMYR